MIYELIGRLVVAAITYRYGAGLVLTALGVAGYLATRSETEPAS